MAGGTVIVFTAFLLLGAAGTIFHGTPRLVCGIIFRIGALVLLFFTVWMGALHRTFDYKGKARICRPSLTRIPETWSTRWAAIWGFHLMIGLSDN